jgi:hypothetical protein
VRPAVRCAARGQSKNHRTEDADQSNFDPAHAEKDEAADRQDRSRTANRKLKLKFIGLLCRD